MAPADQRPIWLTSLGQTVYENLNPFWLYCETAGATPSCTVLFYEREQKAQKERVVKGLATIAGKFAAKRMEIECIDFDDEDVSGFVEITQGVFKKAKGDKLSVIVDISPTTYSFVPVNLVRMAGDFSGAVASVVYLQYGEHRFRQRPYALVPRLCITAHDLLKGLR
ncbi:MAG: hypothetical protein C4530_22720 [Desulfobacteraceae bacterium]|nr:MAG: hypothetical protein C4530_22720 [Desulfobacteraceae bacterium]